MAHDLGAVTLAPTGLRRLDYIDLVGTAGTVTILLALAGTLAHLSRGAFAAAAGLAVPATGGVDPL